jgi:mono/diheme cytochrome c family protein/glucose/arabinose dehydrogenase
MVMASRTDESDRLDLERTMSRALLLSALLLALCGPLKATALSAGEAPAVPPAQATTPPASAPVTARFGPAGAAAVIPAAPATSWDNGRFALADGDTVVFIGQENLVRVCRGGELEARLAAGLASAHPQFRSMAWEGDTVYEQWRDLNFGDWRAQLDAVGATVVVAQFGQVEALDGPQRLGAFTAAYHRLLDQVGAGRRLVLLTPISFEDPLPPRAPRLSARNGDLAAYAEAVRGVARARGALCVDLTAIGSSGGQAVPGRATDDGLHLNDEGRRQLAELVTSQLGVAVPAAASSPALRAAIIEKNRLFFDCWRPANWSFVYGDRITQPFGHAVSGGPSLREVFERHKPMIAAWDARIQAQAGQQEPPPAPAAVALPAADDAVSTPEQELGSFTLEPGWTVSLVASEAQGVSKPTQLTWDERGRLFVACSPSYPHPIPGVVPADYILMLSEQGRDGRFAAAQRWAEGLTMVMGLEPGDGGMYVCDFDHLLHLSDPAGSGHASARRMVMSGFGIGDTHQLINSIKHAPDGSLWFTQGLHAFSRVETPWGLKRLDQAGVWRFDPKTLQLESFFNHGRAGFNCWGVAFDDFGQVFHKSGDRPEGYWSVPGLVPLADPDEYHTVGALFRSDRKTTALEFIGTAAMPDDLQGVAVLGGFFGNTIELHRLRDDGAGFSSTQLPKLLRSSDPCFRPVDVRGGPDGALYVADWCTPVIGHYQAGFADPKRDRRHGRIWRLARTDRQAVQPPRLDGLGPNELLPLLASPERWVRAQVHRLLCDLPPAQAVMATDAFVGLLPAGSAGDRLRYEALNVDLAHGAVRPELLVSLLGCDDARLRAYATRAVGSWAEALPDALGLLAARVADADARVRLEAVVACSRIGRAQAVEVAVRVLSLPHDRFIDYALKGSVRALRPAWQDALGTLTFGGDAEQAGYVRTLATAQNAAVHPGKRIYDALCLACHQPDAKGLPGIYPPLAGSEWVAGDAGPLIRILTNGLGGPITVKGQAFGQQLPLPMPPMGLDDQQAADVLTYLRASFGNQAAGVEAGQVHAVRAQSATRQQPWTMAELGR